MAKKEIITSGQLPQSTAPLSHATRFGNLVFVQGCTGRSPTTGAIGADIKEQTTFSLERIALILLLPFAIGQVVQGWTKQFIARHQPKIIWIDRFVIALAVYVAFSGAVEQNIWGRVEPLGWAREGFAPAARRRAYMHRFGLAPIYYEA